MPYAFLAVTSELERARGRHAVPEDVDWPALGPPEPVPPNGARLAVADMVEAPRPVRSQEARPTLAHRPDAAHAVGFTDRGNGNLRRGRARGRRIDLELRTVERVKDFVEAHYAEQISLRDVAHELAYSAAHLTDTFRRVTGTAVTAWIIKRRVEAAQELLREGDTTVASACERVGFNDLCYFTRQFVRLIGTTPGRYRAEVRHTTSSTREARRQAR